MTLQDRIKALEGDEVRRREELRVAQEAVRVQLDLTARIDQLQAEIEENKQVCGTAY